ncbi:anti-sigma factor family protein [Terricaulis sp.]|uniref:anti-sigma factor family protein n=1 Tax=Terricaulis sp. TaxID=2768686 RepID=UPI0037834D9D
MTPIDDDMLMAYADGELSREDAARVEAAIDEDPALLRKIERFRNMKRILKKTYDSVLDEPVPEQLRALLGDMASKEPETPRVVDLAATREARAEAAPGPQRRFTPPAWAAIAASLVVGVIAGRMIMPQQSGLFAMQNGQLVARAELAQALDTRLASDDANATAPTRIGFSFRSRDGQYCRTFTHAEGDNGVSGLACADNGRWRVRVTASETAQGGPYRQAASPAPEVLAAVDALIDGEALEAAQEREARDRRWRD